MDWLLLGYSWLITGKNKVSVLSHNWICWMWKLSLQSREDCNSNLGIEKAEHSWRDKATTPMAAIHPTHIAASHCQERQKWTKNYIHMEKNNFIWRNYCVFLIVMIFFGLLLMWYFRYLILRAGHAGERKFCYAERCDSLLSLLC